MMCDETHRLWPYEGTFHMGLLEFTRNYVTKLRPNRGYIPDCFSVWTDAALQNPIVGKSSLEERMDSKLEKLIQVAEKKKQLQQSFTHC